MSCSVELSMKEVLKSVACFFYLVFLCSFYFFNKTEVGL